MQQLYTNEVTKGTLPCHAAVADDVTEMLGMTSCNYRKPSLLLLK